MRTLFLTAVAAAAIGAATPALAQDQSFSGPRIGGLLGYDIVTAGSSEDSDVPGDDQSADGFLYGADIGYDVNLGGVVLGVEGEITGSTGKVDNDPVDPNYFGFGRVSTGRDLYVGARLGKIVARDTLLYVKGGYTNQRLNVLASNGTTELDDHFDLDGWRLGAGVERAMGRNTYAKLEYRYSNYSNARLDFADGSATPNFDVDTDRHQIVAGIGVRF